MFELGDTIRFKFSYMIEEKLIKGHIIDVKSNWIDFSNGGKGIKNTHWQIYQEVSAIRHDNNKLCKSIIIFSVYSAPRLLLLEKI